MRRFLSSLVRHLQQGSLGAAVSARLHGNKAKDAVLWTGRSTRAAAIARLVASAEQHLADKPGSGGVVTLGDSLAFHQLLNAALRKRQIRYRAVNFVQLQALTAEETSHIAVILCAYEDARGCTESFGALTRTASLSTVPVEYTMGLLPEMAIFDARDEYPATYFVSPLLLSKPSPYALYEESLQHCPQKCGLRDYLDLYQLLKMVVDNGVDGDIAEFGAYEGHSGWLIARSLQALGSDKRVYLFDTFDGFPIEALGVDQFWNGSHPVQFEAVQARMQRFERVQLVRGDFTQTLAVSGVQRVALAHIDCDSYRATRFLLPELLEKYLCSGGLLACEDYGHPALLGCRVAVEESLAGRSSLFRFFSQFSGMLVVRKP